MDDLKDRRGYCQLKEEALDRTMWRNRFERGFGPVVSQITDDDDDILYIVHKLDNKIFIPFTLPQNMVYPALLPLMRTPRLSVVDWTDAPRPV